MSTTMNKMDMSLDDIIRLDKENKTGTSPMKRTLQEGKARNTKRGNTSKKNNKIPVGMVIKNKNNAILQRKILNAQKLLREAKWTSVHAKKRKNGKARNKPQKRILQQNRSQNNKRNTFSLQTLNTNKRPRIDRNYGSQTSNQFNNTMKKKKFTANTISLPYSNGSRLLTAMIGRINSEMNGVRVQRYTCN